MTKHPVKQIAMATAVCSMYAINANASTSNDVGSSSNIIVAVVVILGLVIGLKIVSANLKKVGKTLEDNFGEKVLP